MDFKTLFISGLPAWINILFLATAFITIAIFHYSNGKPKKITALILIWSLIQCVLAYSGFYQDTESVPPRFVLVLPPAIVIIIYSLTKKQVWILENRNTKISTFLHAIRLPVEIVLHQLFLFKVVPQLMTYEGYNFDIIMGITSLIVGMLYLKNKLSTKLMITWNIVGLILIFIILILALLSAELPFQQFAFDQPNVAVIYFPFILLPATVVPLVIWTHISDLIVFTKR